MSSIERNNTTYPAPVPKTGQKKCYQKSNSTWSEVSCGDNNKGQDGKELKGVKWPSPRFTVNKNSSKQDDGTVTDNLTGLIWLKNANCTENIGGVTFDKDGKLNWNDALTFANKLANGNCGLSDNSKAGDWRLPNVRELCSLIDYGQFNPALSNTAGTGKWAEGKPFTNVKSDFYWSSSTVLANTSLGWYVNLNYGNLNASDKTCGNNYVWPVRDEIKKD